MSTMVSGWLYIAAGVTWAVAAALHYVGGSLAPGVLMTFAALMFLAGGAVWLVRYSRDRRQRSDHASPPPRGMRNADEPRTYGRFRYR
ncbi:Flp pilus assembly protein TadB [Streptomonospora salina]|uniref:Flp pilus assembly protein TadB n=1 Tax=Streptomonospora salina TaxID=104205 RepID=A0A841E647_9ACTN|nr:Flp pilus assembly protein TadB [Streptomonospora salina]